jgi:activator of Hsp90 ATPase-like protein
MSTISAVPSTELGVESLTLSVIQEIHVRATLEDTFAALLEQIGPGSESPDGKAFPMKIEPWPGGRWFRDLGENNGHLWGHVQAIKRPTLLEITGPLFMSYAVVSNVQYRLTEADGGTLIKFQHKALGVIQDDHRQNVGGGWGHILSRVRARAEAGSR